MIIIKENNKDRLIIKDHPAKYWLAFMFLAILIIIDNYYLFFLFPISSSLTCNKVFLNTANCELVESSLINKNLTHRTVANIHKAKQGTYGQSHSILLKTEIRLKGNIKNIYFPSRSLIRTHLYRSNRKLQRNIKQINDFIHSWNNQTLILNKKMPSLFFIVVWLMPLPILVPLTAIFIYPIVAYSFDSQKNSLTIQELIFFSPEEKRFYLNELKISSSVENKAQKYLAVYIKTSKEKTYEINDFENKEEALNLLKLLSQYI